MFLVTESRMKQNKKSGKSPQSQNKEIKLNLHESQGTKVL